MKKIVRQQNYFKELIETQSNPLLTRQALTCWVRSAIEPLLDNPETGVVLYRIENQAGLTGLLKRLEFSEIKSINYSDQSENLIEKVWANTEFICVLTHRFVAILIWDNNTNSKDLVKYYSLYNSKLQYEPLNIIKRNSKIDIAEYIENFNPDRRDNVLLNNSIRKLLSNLEESSNDVLLGFAEQNAESFKESDYIQKQSRIVAHELRNQLSICDLYTEIIRKAINAGNLESVKNAVNSINKALRVANNSLLSLKSNSIKDFEEISIAEIAKTSAELAKVYIEDKEIELQIETEQDGKVIASNESLTAVIINLIKNAVEAFGTEQESAPINGKYIKIKTENLSEEGLNICVSNNATGIKDPEKIFNEGYTTKATGSGLGLWICKKSIEEMRGTLVLSRSSEDYTEFTINFKGE